MRIGGQFERLDMQEPFDFLNDVPAMPMINFPIRNQAYNQGYP